MPGTQQPTGPPAPRGRVVLAWAAVAIAGLVAVVPLDQRLRGPAAPNGVVSYELAGTADRAQAMLDQWAGDGVTDVAWSMMGIDLVYPLIYGAALLVGLRWAAARAGRGPRSSRWSWLAVGAAAADYVENAGLLWQLGADRATAWSAGLAAAAAYLKFGLILGALVVIALLALRGRRPGAAGG